MTLYRNGESGECLELQAEDPALWTLDPGGTSCDHTHTDRHQGSRNSPPHSQSSPVVSNHRSLDPGCPWKGPSPQRNNMRPTPMNKPQRAWRSHLTPPTIPPLHLWLVEPWPWLHLKKSPRPASVTIRGMLPPGQLSQRLHLNKLEEERHPEAQAPPAPFGGKAG